MSRPITVTITGTCAGVELDKRQRLPGIIVTCTCPECGEPCQRGFEGDGYLGSPTVGEPIDLAMYCDECDGEFSIRVVVGLTLAVAPEELPPRRRKAKS